MTAPGASERRVDPVPAQRFFPQGPFIPLNAPIARLGLGPVPRFARRPLTNTARTAAILSAWLVGNHTERGNCHGKGEYSMRRLLIACILTVGIGLFAIGCSKSEPEPAPAGPGAAVEEAKKDVEKAVEEAEEDVEEKVDEAAD